MKRVFVFLTLLGLAAGTGQASEPASDAVIPSAHLASRYEQSWTKNPFLLRRAEPPRPNHFFGNDWALQGMADLDGKVRVTIVNTKTGEYRHLNSQEAAGADFHLIRAHFSRYRPDAFAEIQKGTERAIIKYSQNR